uniref:splicing factor U2af large subunit B-like n=1 Tax=Epinephelus lanceolatus TaxID=310571 RepID=UPI0014480417|nr:splicing factor U2af large subunit B-like [Epinephelus lanceolatus]
MCDVPTPLHDHLYWRREPHRSPQEEQPAPSTSASTSEVAGGRKRQREESRSRGTEEDRRCRSRSRSPQPSTSTPQARPEDVQLEERTSQPGPLQQPVDDVDYDDVMALPLWPSVYGPQPGGLPPTAFNEVAAMIMAWMTDSPYNREM